MVALTGIERAKGQFRLVQLGLTRAFYVDLVPRRPGNMPHGRLASSLGRHPRHVFKPQSPSYTVLFFRSKGAWPLTEGSEVRNLFEEPNRFVSLSF
jgi:hypothetical protein